MSGEHIRIAEPDELPVLRGSGAHVSGLAADARVSLKGLARGVMADPALALQLLHRANAVPHRHFRQEVSTLEDAIRMLGTEALVRRARQARVADDVMEPAVLACYRRAAAQGMLAALLAAELAETRHDLAPPEVTLAALLHNLGELCLLAGGDRRIRRYLALVDEDHVLPHEAEYVTLGESLEDVGHAMAEAWGLPEMVREAMRARNALHMRTLGVMLAAQLARHALSGWARPTVGSDLDLTADYLDTDLSGVAERVDRVLESFNGEVHRYGLAPLSRLPAHLQSPAYRAHFCLAPRSDLFAVTLGLLRGGSIDDRAEVMAILCRGLHQGLGLNRVVFAGLDPRSRVLAAEVLQGTDFEPAFNRFRLPLREGGIVAKLLEGPAALWLNEANRARVWPLVPEGMRRLIGVEEFFIMSVFAGDRAAGLVYADRRCGRCRLDARAYGAFRLLVRLAAGHLERFDSGSADTKG